MLQSTWMDLVLGVDIHIMLVPTPAGPVPTPLPHPFTGLVLDPVGAAMNAAMGGSLAVRLGDIALSCSDPVRMPRLITGQVDLELTGLLPLRFERNYDTASSGRESPFGRGWSHNYDEAVWVERGVVVYRNEDGREIEFSTLGLPDRVLSPGGKLYEPCERLTLEALSGGKYVIRNVAGVAKHFEPVRPAPPGHLVASQSW